MNHILLSIVVPVFNVEKYVKECVESLTCDDVQHMEIILIDDGSQDLSGDICDELEHKYSCVRCIHKENAGVSQARNDGLLEAKGKYIAFVDADDRIVRGGIQAVLQWAAITDIDICFMQAIKFFPDGIKVDHGDRIVRADIYGKNKSEVLRYLASRPKYPGSACTKIFRKGFLLENDMLFGSQRTHGEDLAFVLDCLFAADSFDALDVPYYEYRMNREGSASNAIPEKQWNQLSAFVSDYAERLTTNRKAKNEMSASFMAFIAYEYSILLWHMNRMYGVAKKDALDFMRQYRWVMDYAATRNTKVIGGMIKVLGVSIASICVKAYMCFRGRKQ